jgi:hypothetical protein
MASCIVRVMFYATVPRRAVHVATDSQEHCYTNEQRAEGLASPAEVLQGEHANAGGPEIFTRTQLLDRGLSAGTRQRGWG